MSEDNFIQKNVTFMQEAAEQLMSDEFDSLKESEQEVLALHDLSKVDKWADSLSFEDIMKLTFPKALTVIQHLSMKQRIAHLSELTRHLDHCYEQTKKYDVGLDKDEQMSAKVFLDIMGKIKHLEIIRNWLFGIE